MQDFYCLVTSVLLLEIQLLKRGVGLEPIKWFNPATCMHQFLDCKPNILWSFICSMISGNRWLFTLLIFHWILCLEVWDFIEQWSILLKLVLAWINTVEVRHLYILIIFTLTSGKKLPLTTTSWLVPLCM
jgi:hypothetical protein